MDNKRRLRKRGRKSELEGEEEKENERNIKLIQEEKGSNRKGNERKTETRLEPILNGLLILY